MALILFFLCLSSGSVYAAARWGRKYEELLPVTGCAIVAVLFCFGVLGRLETGFWAVCALCAGLYLLAGIATVRKKSWPALAKNLFTPGFFLFVLFQLLFAFCNFGRLLSHTDEFSHWGDIVKVLFQLGTFGTAPEADSLFGSYPPGMALMQYFLQMLSGSFSEWLLYYAYQVFGVTLFMPLCRRVKEGFLGWLLFAAGIFCGPLLFFPEYYQTILIDGFLGLLAGAGFCYVAWGDRKDPVRQLTLCLIIFLLVLTKDAGLLFACILALLCWGDCPKGQRLPVFLGLCLSLALPKLLWSNLVAAGGAGAAFGGRIDPVQLVDILLWRDGGTRQRIWERFCRGLIAPKISILSLGELLSVKLPVVAVILGLVVLVAVLLRLAARKKEIPASRSREIPAALLAQSVIYTFGLGVMYLFKMSEGEALALASFDRYMAITFQPLWTVLVMALVLEIPRLPKPAGICAAGVLLCLLAVTAPVRLLLQWGTRQSVAISQEQRSPYLPLIQQIQEKTPENARIFAVCQEDLVYDRLVLHFCIRPRTTAQTWSLGSKGLPWMEDLSRTEWKRMLLEDYDYVAIYRLNAEFVQRYGPLFENPGDIRENTLFRVDRQGEKLVLCP